MKLTFLSLIGVSAILFAATPLPAHHSFAATYMEDAPPVEIKGTLKSFKIQNPHSYVQIEDEKLTDKEGNPLPINNVLTQEEWEQAFKLGVRNALDAGCMTEGVIPFFEAFEKMKVRPPWAVYFMPDNARFSKLKKEIERIQRRFLQGEE